MRIEAELLDRLNARRILAAIRDGEPITVGCIRSSAQPYVPSVLDQCDKCQRGVWISQRIQPLLQPDTRILCLKCISSEV